jgi:hypothetical protein
MVPVARCMVQPNHTRDTTMKRSRLALFAFAAVIAIASLAGSYSPAAAGVFGADYGWMGNKKYMDCLKYVGAFGADYPGRDKNIEACKRNYLH